MARVLSVVGWVEYQHYKDRDPPWIKLYKNLLTSEPWVLGTDTSRLVQVASLLLAARYSNFIPLNWALIHRVSSLDCTEEQFIAAVTHLVQHKFLEVLEIADPASTPLATCATTSSGVYSEERREDLRKDPPTPQGGKRAARAGDASRGTRIPEPFMVTGEMREWLAKECPNVKLEAATREFCDYWRGVPGQRGRKTDWPATWRNRMREVEGRLRSRNGAAAALNHTAAADDEAARLTKLKDRRPLIGLADFRDPNPGESSDAYLAAQNAEWNARQPKDRPDLTRKPPLSAVTALVEAKKIA